MKRWQWMTAIGMTLVGGAGALYWSAARYCPHYNKAAAPRVAAEPRTEQAPLVPKPVEEEELAER